MAAGNLAFFFIITGELSLCGKACVFLDDIGFIGLLLLGLIVALVNSQMIMHWSHRCILTSATMCLPQCFLLVAVAVCVWYTASLFIRVFCSLHSLMCFALFCLAIATIVVVQHTLCGRFQLVSGFYVQFVCHLLCIELFSMISDPLSLCVFLFVLVCEGHQAFVAFRGCRH